MTHVKAMVHLRLDSAMPLDFPVNTFHFDATLLADPLQDIADALKGAYDVFASSLPAVVEQTLHSIKMYNMLDPTPRAPIFEDTWDLASNPAGDSLPPEVALCVSFQGARESGVPQSRRRGRVYLGPCKEDDNNALGVPGASIIADAVGFGQFLLEASNLNADYTWCVYSPTDNALIPVTNGWVDNAWDIQRRRGLAPTVRSTFQDP